MNFYYFFIFLPFLLQQLSSQANEPFLFEPVGQMATSLSYLHTMITLNLSTIEEQVFVFKNMLVNKFARENVSMLVMPSSGTRVSISHLIKEITKMALRDIEELEDELSALKLSLPPAPHSEDFNHGYVKQRRFIRDDGSSNLANLKLDDEVVEPELLNLHKSGNRTKRFLPFLALLTLVPGVMGTALGIYNTAQISHVWSEITKNTRQINSLIKVAEEHQAFMLYLEKSLFDLADAIQNTILYTAVLNRVTNQIRLRIHKSIHTIQQANHRRLAIDYLSPHESTLLYSRLLARAESYSCELGIDKHSDLFQLEVSYFFNGNTVSLVLHVPIFPKDSFLRLFKLHPFPLPFTDTHLVFPDTRDDILGISNLDSSYSATFGSTDLLACHRVNQVFFCDRNGVLRMNLGGSCLGCLYQQDFVGAKVFCRFYLEPLQEYVYQLLENWFLIFSPKPQTAPILCQNGTRKELHIPAHTSKFHLSPGCTIQLKRHKVHADLSIKLPSDFLLVQWKWEPLEMLNITQEQLSQSLIKLAQNGLHRPHLNELQLLISSLKQESTWLETNHHYLIHALLGTAIILILLFLGYRIYLWKCVKPKPHPSAMDISGPTGLVLNRYELHPLNSGSPSPQPPAYVQPT